MLGVRDGTTDLKARCSTRLGHAADPEGLSSSRNVARRLLVAAEMRTYIFSGRECPYPVNARKGGRSGPMTRDILQERGRGIGAQWVRQLDERADLRTRSGSWEEPVG